MDGAGGAGAVQHVGAPVQESARVVDPVLPRPLPPRQAGGGAQAARPQSPRHRQEVPSVQICVQLFVESFSCEYAVACSRAEVVSCGGSGNCG